MTHLKKCPKSVIVKIPKDGKYIGTLGNLQIEQIVGVFYLDLEMRELIVVNYEQEKSLELSPNRYWKIEGFCPVRIIMGLTKQAAIEAWNGRQEDKDDDKK